MPRPTSRQYRIIDLAMKRLLAFLGILTALTVKAQHPYYWSLTEDDGLPSNVVYDLIQDSRGYFWIGTEKGLARYNGQEMKTYSSSEQKSLALTRLQEDDQGRIWGVNFSQQVFYVENDTLKELVLPTEDDIKGHVKVEWDSNHLYVYSYYRIDRLDLRTMSWETDFLAEDWAISKTSGQPAPLSSLSANGGRIGALFTDQFLLVENGTIQHTLHLKSYAEYMRTSWFADEIVLTSGKDGRIIRINPETGDTTHWNGYHQKHGSAVRLFDALEEANNHWVCTSQGAWQMNKGRNGQLYFPKEQVPKVVTDHEGNLWFASLQNGVLVVPNCEMLVFDTDNSKLTSNKVNSLGIGSNQDLLIGTSNGVIQRLDKAHKFSPPIDFGIRKEVNGFVTFGNLELAFGDHFFDLKSHTIMPYSRSQNVKQIDWIRKDEYFSLSSDELVYGKLSGAAELPTPLASATWIRSVLGQLIEHENIKSFAYSREPSKLYVSSTTGLYAYDDNLKQEVKLPNGNSVYGTELQLDDLGRLWVSTVSNGLLCFDGDKLVHQVAEEFRLSDFELDGQKIWVVSTDGLVKVDITSGETELFNKLDGLPSNSVNDIVVKNGTVWLATNKGLVSLPTDLTSVNSTVPRLEIAGISVNHKPVSELESLSYQQNNVAFELSPIAFRNRGKAAVHYRLFGLSDEWKKVPVSQANAVSFLALRAGDYTFEVKLLNEDGIESERLIRSFSISPPFWQTWWFYVLLAGSTILLVSGIFLFRIREIRKRDRVQHDLRASELTALKAQMNPHFVFNALNSIQDYILLNQTELANDYLGKFARLMRKTLDQSQQHTVTLSEEIDLLKLYLELEAIRFEEEFEYHVNVDENLNTEQIEIPSMIVQPFVENAIKHGLLHKKDDRKLLVDFKMTENVLECRIEDNGIGLEASKQLNAKRPKTHRSFGTGAVKKRLDLLNEGRKERISVEMKDMTDRAAGVSGTHVLLRIPILNANEHA